MGLLVPTDGFSSVGARMGAVLRIGGADSPQCWGESLITKQ